MDELAEQIVQHFPKEDKVFSKDKTILKRQNFFKDLISNSFRNPGLMVMGASHAVNFFTVFVTSCQHVIKWSEKPTTHPI